MSTVRRRFVPLVTVIVLIGVVSGLKPLLGRAQEPRSCDCDSRKQYYLSTERVRGGEVREVCRAGFHMASAWEILDHDVRPGFEFKISRSRVWAALRDLGLGSHWLDCSHGQPLCCDRNA
jgi:hypothetical protein